MYLRLLLTRQDAERTRLAGVQADLVSIHNAMQQSRSHQHNQYVDIMRLINNRLSRCRLSQIGFACTTCSQAATDANLARRACMPMPPTDAKARPTQRATMPCIQPRPMHPKARQPAVQSQENKRPRGSVAHQCPIWYPQQGSSSSSSSVPSSWSSCASSAAEAAAGAEARLFLTADAEAAEAQAEAEAEAAARLLTAAAAAAADAAVLRAALPAAPTDATAPVTPDPDPELEPEPGSS
jgi:hypothetical protein